MRRCRFTPLKKSHGSPWEYRAEPAPQAESNGPTGDLAGLLHVPHDFREKANARFGVAAFRRSTSPPCCVWTPSIPAAGAMCSSRTHPTAGEWRPANCRSRQVRAMPFSQRVEDATSVPMPCMPRHGVQGFKASKLHGFCCRAPHNLWVLLEEKRWLEHQIAAGTYASNYVPALIIRYTAPH